MPFTPRLAEKFRTPLPQIHLLWWIIHVHQSTPTIVLKTFIYIVLFFTSSSSSCATLAAFWGANQRTRSLVSFSQVILEFKNSYYLPCVAKKYLRTIKTNIVILGGSCKRDKQKASLFVKSIIHWLVQPIFCKSLSLTCFWYIIGYFYYIDTFNRYKQLKKRRGSQNCKNKISMNHV